MDVFEALDALESRLANADKVKVKKSEVLALLKDAITATAEATNTKAGAKSILSRLKKTLTDIEYGLQADRLSLKQLRIEVRDRVGVLHTALRTNEESGLSDTHKRQVRSYEKSEERGAEVSRIVAEYMETMDYIPKEMEHDIPVAARRQGEDAAAYKARAKKYSEEIRKAYLRDLREEIEAALSEFLDTNFSLGQLRMIATKGNEQEITQITPADVLAFYRDDRKVISEWVKVLRKNHDEGLKSIIGSYQNLESRLPSSVKNDIQAIRYPVVPVFQDISASKDPEKLKWAGFDVTQIGPFFQVLENQMLLVFRREGKDDLQRIKDFVDHLNDTNDSHLVLVSDKFVRNPKNSAYSFAWILPENQFAKLHKILRSTKVLWDIPHSSMFE